MIPTALTQMTTQRISKVKIKNFLNLRRQIQIMNDVFNDIFMEDAKIINDNTMFIMDLLYTNIALYIKCRNTMNVILKLSTELRPEH
jgi:hypothetical protein